MDDIEAVKEILETLKLEYTALQIERESAGTPEIPLLSADAYELGLKVGHREAAEAYLDSMIRVSEYNLQMIFEIDELRRGRRKTFFDVLSEWFSF